MKNQVTRQLVESLCESVNEDFIDNINDMVNGVVSESVDNISHKSPFVSVEKCVLLPVSENFNGAFAQLSSMDYFLGVENPQIELYSRSRKNVWKYFWTEFKASWRIGRKKYKKKKKQKKNEVETVPIRSIEKYKLSDFRHDIFLNLANYFTSTTMLYENMTNVSLIGSEDFGTGVKINIYIGVYDSKTETFKIYNEIKNKYTEINFGKRFDYFNYKLEECGEIFVDMIKIINSLYSKVYNRIPNQILVESMIFSCPNKLFIKDDIYQTFVNIANYICLLNPIDFVSICDNSKSIFDEPLITKTNAQLEYNKIIRVLENFQY